MDETKEIVKVENNAPIATQEQIALLKDVVAREQNLTDDELKMFVMVSSKTGLDPFTRQIYAVKREGKLTFQTSIDGFRSIADRTGAYAGNDDYLFNGGLNEYQMIENGCKRPITATSTVYKVVGGQRCPYTATARWEEYAINGKSGFMWTKMPFLMLGKCAEALALRKAFPAQMSGLYTGDEMQQADVKIEGTIEPPVYTSEQGQGDDVRHKKEALRIHIRGLLDKPNTPSKVQTEGYEWLNKKDHDLDVLQEADDRLVKMHDEMKNKQTPEVDEALNDDNLQNALHGIDATQNEGNLTEGGG